MAISFEGKLPETTMVLMYLIEETSGMSNISKYSSKSRDPTTNFLIHNFYILHDMKKKHPKLFSFI